MSAFLSAPAASAGRAMLEPCVVVRVAGVIVALPIALVAHMEPTEQAPALDLGELMGFGRVQPGGAILSLRCAAGLVAVAIDGIVEVLSRYDLTPLPALTLLSRPGMLHGVLRKPGAPQHPIVLLDGPTLGDLVAERILEKR